MMLLRAQTPSGRRRGAARSHVALLLLAAVSHLPAVDAAPFVPDDDAVVLERLPTPGDETARELRRLRSKLSDDPGNLELALRLARRYIALGRAESDPRYNGYAQAALAPWWNAPDPPADVLVLRAVLRQHRHDFDAALADLSAVLQRDPRNPQALLTRAVILQVRGRAGEAMRACAGLRGVAENLVRAACLSGAASRVGRAREAYVLLGRSLERAPRASPPVRLWASTTLAEIAASLGRVEDAERHFGDALEVGIKDAYLLNAYADFLLDQEREGEVLALLAGETRADGMLLRVALAESRLAAPRLAEHVAALEARFAASRKRGDAVHLRDEARFVLHLLDRPRAALGLAKANWRLQREPWDARLFLEAALAAESPGEAAAVVDWLEETGLEDVHLRRLARRLEAGDS